jgi:hypothetical protein
MPVALSPPFAQKASNSVCPSDRACGEFEQLTFRVLHGEEHGRGPRVFAVRPIAVVQVAKPVAVYRRRSTDPFAHPPTCRQIFYRLVGAHDYEKTEKGYARLCEMLTRARRAEMVDMGTIRDDGGQKIEPLMWASADELVQNLRYQVKDFRLDRQEGQETRLVVMCEAAGMAPQLASAVDDYGISVISSGGFDSVTDKHNCAEEMSCHTAVEVLHVGDHDPSGAHIFLALQEDVEAFGAFYGLSISFTRLAVTAEQVINLALPTAPKVTAPGCSSANVANGQGSN